MPILAASSGIVMPGCPCTNDSASAARVPLPLRRPARRLAGRPGLRAALGAGAAAAAGAVAFAFAFAAFLRLLEPFGRPGPRRRVTTAVASDAAEPITLARADAAASR